MSMILDSNRPPLQPLDGWTIPNGERGAWMPFATNPHGGVLWRRLLVRS